MAWNIFLGSPVSAPSTAISSQSALVAVTAAIWAGRGPTCMGLNGRY